MTVGEVEEAEPSPSGAAEGGWDAEKPFGSEARCGVVRAVVASVGTDSSGAAGTGVLGRAEGNKPGC